MNEKHRKPDKQKAQWTDEQAWDDDQPPRSERGDKRERRRKNAGKRIHHKDRQGDDWD